MKQNYSTSLEHSTKKHGMNPILKLIMWMSIFLLIFTVENVYSQGDTLNCTEVDTCSVPWETKSYIGNLGSGITALIYYRVRRCLHPQFMIDSVFALDNGRFLDSVNRYHYSYNAFSDLADVYLLQHHYNNYTQIPWDPDTNNAECIFKFYKASCGIFLNCTYKVVSDFYPKCDSGYDPPYPTSLSPHPQFLSIYKWHPCGKVCCSKIFFVRRKKAKIGDGIDDGEAWIVEIKYTYGGFKHKENECTEQQKFIDSGDGFCQHGC